MRFYRDPLLHFAVAGALLFVGYALMNRGETDPPSTEPVHIGNGEVRWLKETFANQWQRTPTDDELSGLVAGLIEEELLAREAKTLGLDQNEPEVSVSGDVIVVMDPATRFYAIYSKSSDQSRVVLKRSRPTTDRALLAGARRAANAKARELGWIASRCMSMATQNRSIQLASSVRDCRSHVCAFFHS